MPMHLVQVTSTAANPRQATSPLSKVERFPIAVASRAISSLSSAEAEHVAPCDATCDVAFVHKILSRLAVANNYPLILKTDEQSAIHHVVNNAKHTDTKHFAIKFQSIKGKVALEYISSEQQPTDAVTKVHYPTLRTSAVELLLMLQI
jgi:hypothetical protein